jgi:8-amino-7-oxononanoate synthase
MQFSERLLEKGIFAQGIRPPTVPPGTSRLRITLMATHTRSQIDRAIETFRQVKEET